MFLRRMIGLILAGALFCATGSLGSVCQLYCNTAPPNRSHSDMSGHGHHTPQDMANCRDCLNHGVGFSMSDSSCHHMDQAQALAKSAYGLTPSSANWQAVGLSTRSGAQSRGRGPEGFREPLTPQQSRSSMPPIVSLRI